jgi:precorrin-8X/cobalt-precorrin-8 methylmutase
MEQGFVLHAEIYPSLVPPSPHESIKDAGQVRALAEYFARLDEEHSLAELFDLSSLRAEKQQAVVLEEGWILGVRPEAAPE